MSTCPKGNPCPEGFSDPKWCSVCIAEAKLEKIVPEVAPTGPTSTLIGDDDDDYDTIEIRAGSGGIVKKLRRPVGLDPGEIILPISPNTTTTTTTTTTNMSNVVTTKALTHMVQHSMAARFDGHCKLCGAGLKAGELIAGVQPSFYESAPLRWLCVECGKAYDKAYDELANLEGGKHGEIKTVNSKNVMLTYEWDELEERWREVRTTRASQWRRP